MNEKNLLLLEASPHIKSPASTTKIMGAVILSLCPALAASTYIFGARALILTLFCVICCVGFEWIFSKITKRKNTTGDLSAVVTGILLAFNLPVTMPFYMSAIGCFTAIVVVKQMFGGIGQNFANPAIVGRIVLQISFASHMNKFILPVKGFSYTSQDAVTGATPLGNKFENGDLTFTLKDLFFGYHGGVLGETCALALLIGGAFLLVTKIISPAAPFAFISSLMFLSGISNSWNINEMLFEVLTGGVILGAFFMATDYATSPLTATGKIIFGLGCGIITFVIRHFAAMNEGVSYSILIMNIATPYIDRFCTPKVFGSKKPKKA